MSKSEQKVLEQLEMKYHIHDRLTQFQRMQRDSDGMNTLKQESLMTRTASDHQSYQSVYYKTFESQQLQSELGTSSSQGRYLILNVSKENIQKNQFEQSTGDNSDRLHQAFARRQSMFQRNQ